MAHNNNNRRRNQLIKAIRPARPTFFSIQRWQQQLKNSNEITTEGSLNCALLLMRSIRNGRWNGRGRNSSRLAPTELSNYTHTHTHGYSGLSSLERSGGIFLQCQVARRPPTFFFSFFLCVCVGCCFFSFFLSPLARFSNTKWSQPTTAWFSSLAARVLVSLSTCSTTRNPVCG